MRTVTLPWTSTDGEAASARTAIAAEGPIRAAFVMEQALGHVTYFRNLSEVVAGQADIVPTWLTIPFEVRGPSRLIPVLRSNWSVRASWRARVALNAALAARPHDALVFHTQVTSLFSLGIMRRLPSVISLDATPINYDSLGVHYGHRPAGRGPIDRQKYLMNRRAFQAAAGLVTWSEWARRSLTEDYGVEPARVRVIAPGAASPFFEIGERRRPRDGGPVRLLFVGGDFVRKGGPLLLECMRGPLVDRCQLHVVTQATVSPQRNVFVHRGLGPNSPELVRLFAEADVFVLPTLGECLAVVLMEATAAGLPAVTTDVGALSEAVRPGESGMLIPPSDVAALGAAIELLVGDAERRWRMGRAGLALAREKFDAGRNGRALLDLVGEMGQAGRRSRRIA